MCCTDFRDCRKFAAQSGAGRARLLLSWLSCWEDQLETTIGLAWPDAFLGIFISHTFSIYKIALTLRAKLCVNIGHVNKLLFCEICVQRMRQNAELKHAPAADHVPNGIKDPKKIPSVFTQENENHLQNIYGRRSQWSSGVKRMIFHNFCIKASWPGTDRRQSLADASQCLPTNTNAWNNQFPSS